MRKILGCILLFMSGQIGFSQTDDGLQQTINSGLDTVTASIGKIDSIQNIKLTQSLNQKLSKTKLIRKQQKLDSMGNPLRQQFDSLK